MKDPEVAEDITFDKQGAPLGAEGALRLMM